MIRRSIIGKIPSVLAAAVIGALALSSCSPPGQSSTSATGGGGPIKVAVLDAQSGQLSSLGAWELKGVKLAVNEFNDAGGLDGRKIELSVLDEQGDPTVGTNLARKAVSDGAVAVLGPAESAVALAIAPILTQSKIPMITSGQAPKLATTGSSYVFLNSPTSTTFDQTLGKYAVETAKYKKIAMMSNNGAYGKGEHDAFLAQLQSTGTQPIADQIITPDQKDFSAALTTIAQSSPDALFIGAEEVQSGLIAKQARQLGMKAVIIGGAPVGTDQYISTAGAANAEGTIVSTPFLGNDTNDMTKKFAQAYKAAYNEDAELHGAKAYDGAQILIRALKQTRGAGGSALADAIRSQNYAGLMGTFKFDNTGVGVHETQIGIIKSSKLVPLS